MISPEIMVGPSRLELPTSRLSGARSNLLSYGPISAALPPLTEGHATLVEMMRLELTTPCLQSRCSPS